MGYRLSDGAPPKGLPTRRSGLDAAKTLIRSGEIKIISVCVAHYQDAVERGLLKKNSVGPGYPASHTFQRQPGKSLNLMGENADINLSDMKVAVSVMQAPASPVSESLDDTGTCQVNEALDLEISCTVLVNLIRYIELHSLCLCYVLTCCVCFRRNRLVTFFISTYVSFFRREHAGAEPVSASAHRLVFYGYSVNDSSRRIHDALFKNMTKNIPGLTDCASEYTVLFSDIATAPLLSFCISGGDTRECLAPCGIL